ncbi:hypothetical protein NC652_000998 [Populus alba x Populus x berolinensis]|uniref:Uncharacterized protein n=1 Tax=Populus alba x Populus x berolinensis TaxID=444605 RepID=A0AAD6RL42_9ROSI|nr:hypothetical protein NC652_000998 [Populus alba x Populus x berolinensis]KAJ7010450.1 hypothetical protein NC653_001024 [Populus alba x Populus x berolinensis]
MVTLNCRRTWKSRDVKVLHAEIGI